MSFEHFQPTTNMNTESIVAVTKSEYAATWFLLGILVAAVFGLAVHIRNNIK